MSATPRGDKSRPNERRSAISTTATRQAKPAWSWSCSSHLDRGDVDPAPFAPALQRAFRKLHALGAFQQRIFLWSVFADVANEPFPLLLEAVVVDGVLRQRLPVAIEILCAFLVGVPHRPRRRLQRLNDAIA